MMANFKEDIKNQEEVPQKSTFGSNELQAFSDSDIEFLQEDSAENDEEIDVMNGYDDEAENNESDNLKKNNEEEPKDGHTEGNDSGSSDHDGKYFVIQKGMAMCDKGAKFANFKVTSHQKHYWNDEEGSADYLAVTEDDLLLNPPAVPFGTCAVKNGNPCSYAPAGKWTKTYEKVKVMGKSCVTELSELKCAVGGKITIMKHGQQSEAGKSNVAKANTEEQHVYNPMVDFEAFKEEIEDDYTEDYQ